ncbi:MAG: ribbon-helix-helix protein, CopG family [Patescibacteria group bacterium]
MTTLSVSLDEELKKEIERFSKEDGVSKSVVVRRLLKQAAWERTWKDMSSQLRKKFDELNFTTVDDIEKYLG